MIRKSMVIATLIVLIGSSVIMAAPESNEPVMVIAADPLAKCCDEICSVAFSPDGMTVAAKLYHSDVAGEYGLILWDVSTGSLSKAIGGLSDGVYSISFGPDGHTIASSNGQIWHIKNGETFKLGISSDHIDSIIFSPDGRLIASDNGRYADKIMIWDAETGNLLLAFQATTKAGKAVQFSQDGKILVSAGKDALQYWSVDSGRLIRTIKLECGGYGLLAYRSTATIFAVTNCGQPDRNTIELLDTRTGQHVSQLDGHASVIWSLDLSLNGRFLASSSGDLTIKVWDTETGNVIRTLTGHSKIVRTVTFSPDGRTIASGGGDNETKIWSISTGKLIATLRVFKDGNWIVYTPDGYYNRSADAAKYIRWRTNNKSYDEALYSQNFFRPEIVAERLRNTQ